MASIKWSDMAITAGPAAAGMRVRTWTSAAVGVIAFMENR
jgi:hypothetical protein